MYVCYVVSVMFVLLILPDNSIMINNIFELLFKIKKY